MTAEPIDFAAVKAEHEGHLRGGIKVCLTCDDAWPCLPYRLADEAERLAGKVARVEALPVEWSRLAASVAPPPSWSPWDVRRRDAIEIIAQLRAALADQPEHPNVPGCCEVVQS